jgi:hypothetical protein
MRGFDAHTEDMADETTAYSYDLYNTNTEEVEATERLTPDEVARRNQMLRANGEPQRWIATPWVNH